MKKVGEILKEQREKEKLSLLDVEKAIKIRRKFLEAIEEGRFKDLPSESYALGFVKNYAQYLGLSTERISALFRREYSQELREIVPNFRKHQERFNKRTIINSKSFFIFTIFLVVFSYIIFQYSSLLFGPKLEIDLPKDKEITSDNVIQVKGKTDPYSIVFIDGDEVYVGLDGVFKKSLYLFSGDKTITIISKNRFDKETKKTVSIKVK